MAIIDPRLYVYTQFMFSTWWTQSSVGNKTIT
jgi:hypothetical protein